MKTLLTIMLLMLTGSQSLLAMEQYTGTLHWGRQVELGIPVSGIVASINVNVGDQVKKNQKLLNLDQRFFRAKVQQAKADVARTQQTKLEAQREHERAKVLYDRMVLSNKDMLQAESAYLQANAAYESAKAGLQQVKLDQTYSQLRAPFEGMIAKRKVEVGQTIVSRLQADPLIMLVENKRMIARIKAPVAELNRFKIGKTASVQVGELEFVGEISMVGMEPLMNESGTYYDVDVRFLSKGKFLRAGQVATVIIP